MSHADRSRFFANTCIYFWKICTQIVRVSKKERKKRKERKLKGEQGKEKRNCFKYCVLCLYKI